MRRAPYLPHLSPVCSAIALCAVSASGILAQQPSTLPPSQVTSVQPAPQYTAAPPLPQARHADITYRDGLLTVAAANSSLNQILREIARQTGMKITGGVADERVFGTYGPSAPGKVLNTLLDGTGSNMLLVQNASAQPSELILTPRTGSVTPPNPNAHNFDDDQSDAPVQEISPQRGQQAPFSRAPYNPAAPNAPGAQPAPGAQSAPVENYTPSADSLPQSPNGVKTPQQIYDQLMRARQQQQQQQTSPQ